VHAVDKAQIVLEIVLLLQGTPLAEFARHNFVVEGDRAAVRCAAVASVASEEGELCKRSVATALHRFSYRFTVAQLEVLADLYVNALNRLEPEALARVRRAMCSTTSSDARRDAAAAQAVCERLSQDF
jgi:hypothetical protein